MAFPQSPRKCFAKISSLPVRYPGYARGLQSSAKKLAAAHLPVNEAELPPTSEAHSPVGSSDTRHKQTYPLYPSVAHLLHEKDIPFSEVDKIPASGPKGRLLKGDVLAYLGSISSSYPSDQSTRISRLGQLDLRNSKPTPPKKTSTLPSSEPRPPQAAESSTVKTGITIPISLTSVLSVQKRIQTTLGITLPLSTFIARATELANQDLPRSTSKPPTADQLFIDILGLNTIASKLSTGGYIPQITALPVQPHKRRLESPKQPDVYDMLTGHSSSQPAKALEMAPPGNMVGSGAGESSNLLTVSAGKGEEQRARLFLERVKSILQVEPGMLIL